MADATNQTEPVPPGRAPLINMAATAAAMADEGAGPTPGTTPPPEATERAARPARAPGAKKKSGAQRRREAREGKGGAPALDGEVVEGPPPGEMAAQFNGLAFGLMIIVAGESAKPTPQEMSLCNGALGAYLAENPDFKVRPELLLVAAYVPYIARTLATPTLRDKIAFGVGRGWSALRSWFQKKEKTDVAA